MLLAQISTNLKAPNAPCRRVNWQMKKKKKKKEKNYNKYKVNVMHLCLNKLFLMFADCLSNLTPPHRRLSRLGPAIPVTCP